MHDRPDRGGTGRSGQRSATSASIMFVGKTSFHMLTAFLTGYDQHAIRHGAHGLVGWHELLGLLENPRLRSSSPIGCELDQGSGSV